MGEDEGAQHTALRGAGAECDGGGDVTMAYTVGLFAL